MDVPKQKAHRMTELMAVFEVHTVEIRVPTNAAKRRDELIAAGCCIACERKLTDKEFVRRGQCGTCYQATRRNIKAHRVTEAELIRSGELLVSGVGGRPPVNKYTRKLAKGGAE